MTSVGEAHLYTCTSRQSRWPRLQAIVVEVRITAASGKNATGMQKRNSNERTRSNGRVPPSGEVLPQRPKQSQRRSTAAQAHGGAALD